MRIPDIEDLSEYIPSLVSTVAKTSWLPNRETVKTIQCSVFPTSRYKSNHKRFSHIEKDGAVVGMYDDNATPEWALFWSHDLVGTRRKGWTIAHVWPTSDDIDSYTHIANLAMVPECLANLTDKKGPLTAFLRWHAWEVYGWKPKQQDNPNRPDGYGDIEWRYLTGVRNPKGAIRRRFCSLSNERTRILRPIMEGRGIL